MAAITAAKGGLAKYMAHSESKISRRPAACHTPIQNTLCAIQTERNLQSGFHKPNLIMLDLGSEPACLEPAVNFPQPDCHSAAVRKKHPPALLRILKVTPPHTPAGVGHSAQISELKAEGRSQAEAGWGS